MKMILVKKISLSHAGTQKCWVKETNPFFKFYKEHFTILKEKEI